jgi:hypothetical protein
MLVIRNVYAANPGHMTLLNALKLSLVSTTLAAGQRPRQYQRLSTLALLVSRILAYNPYHALTPDNFAMPANALY